MKTLYASDLDGTLLRSNETLSPYTCATINALVEKGMLFSYATARSYVTASRVTRELTARIPLIVYNGTFIIDNVTGKVLHAQAFDCDVCAVLDDLLSQEVYPIVYAMIDGKETFTYVDQCCTAGMRHFVDSRKDDPRKRPVDDASRLYDGAAFYITCVDEESKLKPLYQKYREICHCVYHVDIYTRTRWLEMMPKGATKANAIRHLQRMLECDRLVVFGDGKNDIEMFQIADVSCAMENGEQELKAVASSVIGSNDQDGVAQWLDEHVREEE
ncbi:MAG: HAD family hydrolase [Clostridia bacterium]|nr:HAD family hydrolase [Clostridia bacterium]